MLTFATKPLTTSFTMREEIPQNSMVRQQRQQIWAAIRQIPQSTFVPGVWKYDSKRLIKWLPDKMFRLNYRHPDPSTIVLERIFHFFWCWTRRSRSSRIPNWRRRSVSRNRKPRKRTGFHEEDRSLSWSTTTFEWLALMIQCWITPIHSLLTLHDDNLQEFNTRWD